MKKNIFSNKKVLRFMGVLVALAISAIVIPCDCLSTKDVVAEVVDVKNVPPCHAVPNSSKQHKDHNHTDGSAEHENCCCADSNISYGSKIYIEIDNIKLNPNKLQNSLINFYVLHVKEVFKNFQYTRGSPSTFSVFIYPTNTFLAFLQRFLI